MDRLKAFWDKSFINKLVVGVVGLLVLCCGIGVLNPSSPDEPQTEAQAVEVTDAPAPTATDAPTDTPEPTETPERSTEELVYARNVVVEVQRMGEALGEFGKLAQEAKIGDQDWTIDVAVQISEIRDAHKTLEELSPPERAQELHAAVLNATSDCVSATEQFTIGVDKFDQTALAEAIQFLDSCGEKMSDASSLMEVFMDQVMEG